MATKDLQITVATRLRQAIRQVSIFSSLSSDGLDEIAAIAKVETFRKGRFLFRKDDLADGLYIILRGLIKITQFSHLRKAKTLAILGAGTFFGEMAIINEERRSASAIVLTDAELLKIEKQDFKHLLADNFDITYAILQQVCSRLRAADREIEDHTFKNIEGRLASKLLQLADQFKSNDGNVSDEFIALSLTHQELADLVGTNRETVSHKLGVFRKEGSVKIGNDRKLRILDREKLLSWTRQ
ncbi:MAG: Crp/Fnr family transcriptional regulator [Planctomycetes bacterium]|nr:Crp/Fnr family transcriptional regulator [Planctomycetota bacterium]